MKVLLLVLVLVGAAVAVPSIRHRLAGPLDPVLARLGPLGEKIRTPARRFNAHNELQAITGRLKEDRLMGRRIPTPRQFHAWVRAHMRGDIQDGIDPWGQPYYLTKSRTHFTVGSAGQDTLAGTPDDVRISTPLR